MGFFAGRVDRTPAEQAAFDDPRASDYTARAARLAATARDFTACARLERAGTLD